MPLRDLPQGQQNQGRHQEIILARIANKIMKKNLPGLDRQKLRVIARSRLEQVELLN